MNNLPHLNILVSINALLVLVYLFWKPTIDVAVRLVVSSILCWLIYFAIVDPDTLRHPQDKVFDVSRNAFYAAKNYVKENLKKLFAKCVLFVFMASVAATVFFAAVLGIAAIALTTPYVIIVVNTLFLITSGITVVSGVVAYKCREAKKQPEKEKKREQKQEAQMVNREAIDTRMPDPVPA